MSRTTMEDSIIFILVLLSTHGLRTSEGALSGWSESPTQYHVQNDEGPDRFFRYQTYNGQYRKERRMDDGTVVGSYGWVDPAGFLRMTDYIADIQGYRVVNSRTEFVGVKPEPLQEETNHFKPMKHSIRVIRERNSEFTSSNSTPIPSEVLPSPTVTTLNSVISVTTPNTPNVRRRQRQRRPQKELNFLSLPSATSPKTLLLKPESSNEKVLGPRRRIVKVYMKRQQSNTTTTLSPTVPPLPVSPRPNNPEFVGNRPYIIQVIRGEGNGGKDDVFKGYATPLRSSGNGFLYKIPNQYHKEETETDGSRVGSFGYVDPFGIRRVIHYNAKNTGFAHQVDFKYVGKQTET